MRLVHALGAAVAATALVSSVAKATVTMSLVPLPVNSTAAAAIAPGQTVRTFQLKVSQTVGEKWDVGSLKLTLATGGGLSGYLYANPTVHSNTTGESKPYLNPGQTNTSASFYDTYVTTPAFEANPTAGNAASHLNVVGSSDFPNTGTASNVATVPQTTGNAPATNQTLDIVWGDQAGVQAATDTTGATSYLTAQFTIVGNTGGYIRGYSGGSNAANTAQFFGSNAPLQTLPQGTMYLPILGDTDKNGAVNIDDFISVKNNFNGTGSGDTDGDNDVDIDDFINVKNNFNHAVTPPASGGALGSLVPEPASLSLLMLAGLAGVRRRRSL